MATLFALTNSAWTPIATRGNPTLRVRDASRVRVHVGSVQPALAAVDYLQLEAGRLPVTLGMLAGGRRMWARAEGPEAQLEVDDTGGGPESVHRLLSAAASTNATLIKNSPGRVHRLFGRNAAAALRFLKLYDKATLPTVGTDAPVMTIPLGPSAPFDQSLGENGHLFVNGIGYALTVNAADNDATALTAGDVICMNIQWA